jgi:hypothetical protein
VNALNMNRRPYYSPVVRRGLSKIVRRIGAADEDELAAVRWVLRMERWRVSSEESEPHDAAVSPATRDGGASRPASRRGGAK